MAELRSPDGVSCVVGLGRPRSVVTFNESFAEPPFYLSRGSGMEGENLVFFFNGHWTEFEPDAAVPTSDAIRAIEEFFETGERPSVVQWDEA